MNYFDYSSAHLHAWVSDPTAPRDSDGQLLPAVVAKAVTAAWKSGSGKIIVLSLAVLLVGFVVVHLLKKHK